MSQPRPISLRDAAKQLGIKPSELTQYLVAQGYIHKTQFGYAVRKASHLYLVMKGSQYFHQGFNAYRHCTSVQVTVDGLLWLDEQLKNNNNNAFDVQKVGKL